MKATNVMPPSSVNRWKYQYQRIADVLSQRVEQIRPPDRHGPDGDHGKYVRNGRCYICVVVDAAPPLTDDQISMLRALLGPVIRTDQQPVTRQRSKK